MILFEPISPITNAPPNLDWLGPAILATGSVIVAIVGGVSLIWRRRQDRQDKTQEVETALQPKVTDGWEEVRQARAEATSYYNLYRLFENLFYVVWSALRHLARRDREIDKDRVFEQDIIDALAIVPPDTGEVK